MFPNLVPSHYKKYKIIFISWNWEAFLLLHVHLILHLYLHTYMQPIHLLASGWLAFNWKVFLFCRIVITAATISVTKLVMKDKVTATQMVATGLGCLAVVMVYQNEIFGSSINSSNKIKYSEKNTLSETVTKNGTLFARWHCTVDEDELCNSIKGTFSLEINGTDVNKAHDNHKNSLTRCYEETAYYLMIGIGLAIACGLCNTSKYKGIGGDAPGTPPTFSVPFLSFIC